MPVVEHVIIAVAGLGSRLGLGKPKCLVELEGRPIIEYQLKLLKNIPDIRIVIGFEEFEVINTIKKIRSDVTLLGILHIEPLQRFTAMLQVLSILKSLVYLWMEILFLIQIVLNALLNHVQTAIHLLV